MSEQEQIQKVKLREAPGGHRALSSPDIDVDEKPGIKMWLDGERIRIEDEDGSVVIVHLSNTKAVYMKNTKKAAKAPALITPPAHENVPEIPKLRPASYEQLIEAKKKGRPKK